MLKTDGGTYRNLKVWQKSIDLTERCYMITKSFPRDERFGLTAQLRRSAVSIPSNIAEGYGRDSDGSFVQFLRIAQGSLKEFETQVIISQRIGAMDAANTEDLLSRADEVGKMLRGLINSVNAKG